MSGVKRATVTKSLNGTIRMVQNAINECANAAQSFQNIGKSEFDGKKINVDNLRKTLHRVLPKDLERFLEEAEVKKWQSFIKEHDEDYKSSDDLFRNAESKDSDYLKCKKNYDGDINSIKNEAERIRKSLIGKDWHCDSENEEAVRLKTRAQQILSQMRSNNSILVEAKSLRQQSFVKLSSSENFAELAEKEYDRLVGIAKERQDKERRIAEEKKRKALNLVDDLKSLKKDIESKNFAKFAKGKYSAASVGNRIDSISAYIDREDYDSAISAAENLKAELQKTAADVEAAQQAWMAAKVKAEKVLADAKGEISLMNKSDLKKYSGINSREIDNAFALIDKAENKIAAERFEEATRDIESGIGKLTEIKEAALKNKELAETREAIAQSIMQALYDSNYDSPYYGLEDENDELSVLDIVAAAPGGVGDMTLKIDLSGNVSFEVANIPDGREQLCHNAILDMQKRLAEDEVSFDMTDWGRAENQNKIRLEVKQQEKQLEQIKQRQG